MKIKLNRLTIRNFKGIREYDFEPKGDNVAVFGANATGKTTLYDAFLWALFGKDSTDKTQFDWKPLDKDNNPISHLETSVEVELDIDGQIKTLTRIIKEKWTKVRGSIHETFSGHTTTYQIDGINAKQKDYKSYLEELIGEDTFRMLTNISYFPEKLDWKKRREILIDMAGDISDVDVINSNSELKPLLDVVGDKSIDDINTLTKQRMKEINKQIKELPSRIDEVDRSLPDLSKLDKAKLEKDKQDLLDQVEVKRTAISDIQNGLEVRNLQQEKQQLQLHYKELEREYIEEQGKLTEHLYEENKDLNNQLIELKKEQFSVSSQRERLISNIAYNVTEIEMYEKDKEKLREKFSAKRDVQMAPFDEHKLTCPTCGQSFPEEKLLEMQANYQKEVEAFNTDKSKYLADINEEGQAANKKIEQAKAEIAEAEKELETLDVESIDKQIAEIQTKLGELGIRINNIEMKTIAFKYTEQALDVVKQGEEVSKKIATLEANSEEAITKVNDEIKALNDQVNELNNELFKFNLHDNLSQRKNELIEEEQTLSGEYGNLEQRLFLLEEFIRTKVNLLTDSINQHFTFVKFKLFDTNINGGLEEVCEPTVNGVNYSTGLNNANRINAGLDIVNTLMKVEGISVPVFVDNAEGVNDFIDIDTQLITLSVSKHKTLRVEVASDGD